jgi:hypothetical protein
VTSILELDTSEHFRVATSLSFPKGLLGVSLQDLIFFSVRWYRVVEGRDIENYSRLFEADFSLSDRLCHFLLSGSQPREATVSRTERRSIRPLVPELV